MFQFINKSKNWVVTIVLAIIIGLAVPSLIALASSVIGDNMVITNPTEQLRLNYSVSTTTSFFTNEQGNFILTLSGGYGGLQIINNSISPNIVGGYSGNIIDDDLFESAILSGGFNGGANEIGVSVSVISGGAGNIIRNNVFPGDNGQGNIIGGGSRNKIQGSMPYGSAIVGGFQNIIGDGSDVSTGGNISFIGGGERNKTRGSSYATIVGGQDNIAWHYGFVGGGAQNVAGTSTKNYSVAVGGKVNTASGYNSMILGGDTNTASGTLSFASGKRAKAYNDGSFVWADNSNFDFLSVVNNETAFRSTGGVRFVTAIDGSGNATRTAQFATTGDLNLNGGIKLNTVTAKPACSSTYRGMFWVTQSTTDVEDLVEVCTKRADNSYSWKALY